MIKKSDGWTSGVTGSAGVSTGDPDGGAGILEQGQCDGGTVKTGDGGAGYARLDEGVHVEEVGGSEVGGAESAGVSAVDPDSGACTLVQGHSDDGRVKNCAGYAHDDTKSSVESEVTQSCLVCDAVFKYDTYETRLKEYDIYGFWEREEKAQHEAASMAAMKRFKKDGDDCRPAKRQRSHAIPIPRQSVDALPAFIFIPPGQGLFAALSPKPCPNNLHPESSQRRCRVG